MGAPPLNIAPLPAPVSDLFFHTGLPLSLDNVLTYHVVPDVFCLSLQILSSPYTLKTDVQGLECVTGSSEAGQVRALSRFPDPVGGPSSLWGPDRLRFFHVPCLFLCSIMEALWGQAVCSLINLVGLEQCWIRNKCSINVCWLFSGYWPWAQKNEDLAH